MGGEWGALKVDDYEVHALCVPFDAIINMANVKHLTNTFEQHQQT